MSMREFSVENRTRCEAAKGVTVAANHAANHDGAALREKDAEIARLREAIESCQRQMKRAAQTAELRRLTPGAFDAAGNVLPDHAGEAWGNYVRAHMHKLRAIYPGD